MGGNKQAGRVEGELRKKYTFLPKDYVETRCGCVFAVVAEGVEGDKARVLSFLRYVRRDGELVKQATAEANRFLRSHRPDWIYYSPIRDVQLHGIPTVDISHHWRPRFGRAEEATAERRDIPTDATRLCACLEQAVPDVELGVTGSFLLAAENDQSDIDLLIYGRNSFSFVQSAVSELQSAGVLAELTQQDWREAYGRRGCELGYEDYLWHERRKRNKFMFGERKVDISCVDEPHPWASIAGRKMRACTLRASVSEDKLSFLHPAVYEIDHSDVSVVMSYTPTYAGQAKTGEQMEASGWLEECELGIRLVVGASREAEQQFIRVVRD